MLRAVATMGGGAHVDAVIPSRSFLLFHQLEAVKFGDEFQNSHFHAKGSRN